MDVEIRLASPEEYDAAGEVTVAGYLAGGLLDPDSEYVPELRDAKRRAEQAELWVAVAEGRVLGTVTFCPPGSPYRELSQDGEGEFRMLAVHPDGRRRGIGQALAERCLERAQELGQHTVVLCSMQTMHAAHRIYERLGFVRRSDLDWEPVPGVSLIGFSASLGVRT